MIYLVKKKKKYIKIYIFINIIVVYLYITFLYNILFKKKNIICIPYIKHKNTFIHLLA